MALSWVALGIFFSIIKCCCKMCKGERPWRNERNGNPDTNNDADSQQTTNTTEKVDNQQQAQVQQAPVQQAQVQQNASVGDLVLTDQNAPQVEHPPNHNDTKSTMEDKNDMPALPQPEVYICAEDPFSRTRRYCQC